MGDGDGAGVGALVGAGVLGAGVGTSGAGVGAGDGGITAAHRARLGWRSRKQRRLSRAIYGVAVVKVDGASCGEVREVDTRDHAPFNTDM